MTNVNILKLLKSRNINLHINNISIALKYSIHCKFLGKKKKEKKKEPFVKHILSEKHRDKQQ